MYKVMLVDDEPLVREYLRMHFNSHHSDWEVAADAMDGQEALEKLDSEAFDLVVTDIKMPVMDGLELSRRIQELERPPHVVILTGYDEFALAREAIRYGVVRNYLLKPVVDEELMETIDGITSLLERSQVESQASFAQNSISEDTRKQVIRQFLKAVVSDSDVEIKTLYPLIYRLKVALLETEGIIMLLDLDEHRMLSIGIPPADFPVFRFILQQIAAEISDEAGYGRVFLAEEQLTCVLVTGEDPSQIMERCRKLYRRVAEAVLQHTGITVSGALGTMESEWLELQGSYMAAISQLPQRLYTSDPALFGQDDGPRRMEILPELERALNAVQAAFLDFNEIACSIALKSYIDLLPAYTPDVVAKFGIHLLKSVAVHRRDDAGRIPERAYRPLQRALQKSGSAWSAESLLSLYRDVIVGMASSRNRQSPDAEDEVDVAARAKSYIYAHFAEPLSLASLAEKLGVSPGYVSSTFHKSFNETYIKFLTRVRMEQAAKLLRSDPSEKVYDVAEKVGYVGVKHFSHVFKQHYQMPPGEYQELHHGNKGRNP